MNRCFSIIVSAIFLTNFLAELTTNTAHAAELALPAADVIAPVVEQNDFVSKIEPGKEHQIRVTATDNVAIKSVVLYYRYVGEGVYQTRIMSNIVGTDEYAATLGVDELNGDGIEYYIQATDTAGNTLLLGYAFSPLTILVDRQATGVQFANENEAATTELKPPEPKAEKEKSYKWLWIGLGVLAAGAIAANASGGDDGGGGGGGGQEPTVIVNAPVP